MIDMKERRRFTRYPVYCPVEYKCDNSEPRKSAVTVNFSEGGAFVSVDSPPEAGSEIIIRIKLRGEEMFIRAKVIHVQSRNSKGMGLEFTDPPSQFIRKFYDELETIMLYQRQYSLEAGRPISLAEASMKWYEEGPALP